MKEPISKSAATLAYVVGKFVALPIGVAIWKYSQPPAHWLPWGASNLVLSGLTSLCCIATSHLEVDDWRGMLATVGGTFAFSLAFTAGLAKASVLVLDSVESEQLFKASLTGTAIFEGLLASAIVLGRLIHDHCQCSKGEPLLPPPSS